MYLLSVIICFDQTSLGFEAAVNIIAFQIPNDFIVRVYLDLNTDIDITASVYIRILLPSSPNLKVIMIDELRRILDEALPRVSKELSDLNHSGSLSVMRDDIFNRSVLQKLLRQKDVSNVSLITAQRILLTAVKNHRV